MKTPLELDQQISDPSTSQDTPSTSAELERSSATETLVSSHEKERKIRTKADKINRKSSGKIYPKRLASIQAFEPYPDDMIFVFDPLDAWMLLGKVIMMADTLPSPDLCKLDLLKVLQEFREGKREILIGNIWCNYEEASSFLKELLHTKNGIKS